MVMAKWVVTCCSFLLFSPVTFAQSNISADNCNKITNNAERLKCYDNVASDTSSETVVEQSALQRRLAAEKETAGRTWVITPHKQNYILPVTYNSNVNTEPYKALTPLDPDAENIDDIEVKFQISFKVPLMMDLFNDKADLWFGYTQVAYWQLYNPDISAPFRETNYEPELLLDLKTDYNLFGLNNRHIVFGFNHQSNGRNEPLSRSWNRLFVNFVFEKQNFVMFVKPWWRIPEDDEDDNNPDIDDFLGYGELSAFYKRKGQVYGIMLRNNLESSDNLTTVQLDWSLLLGERLKVYIQYFNGFGDGLIDYNHRNKRIGAGLMLTNWL
jgi:phospholipase A1